ncbi:MAG: hypothetical protein N4A54_06550 [Peptostreptococcaceae bacterium]|jgi:hypothetical protein|nr:hypothetical protein [Peptostreptococcaceae bacterium]
MLEQRNNNEDLLQKDKIKNLCDNANDYAQKKANVLKDFIEKNIKIEFDEEELQTIYLRMEEDFDNIENYIISTFDDLFKEIKEKQLNNEKGIIKYINMSFLKTRLLEEKGVYLIEAFDSNLYLDDVEINKELELEFVYKSHFDKGRKLYSIKDKYTPYVLDEDIKNILLQSSNRYMLFVVEFMKEILKDIVKLDSFKKINKEDQLSFTISEYKTTPTLIKECKL